MLRISLQRFAQHDRLAKGKQLPKPLDGITAETSETNSTPLVSYTGTVDPAFLFLLQIVSELVTRLVQLDVIRTGHDHHNDLAVLALLDRTAKLRPFCP